MNYSSKIEAKVHEVSGNFDKEKLSINDFSYSLHTDSASKPQTFSSDIFHDLEHIKKVQKDGIPQLWYDENWANDFFTFIDWIIGNNSHPEVLEIHPPFNNYPIFESCKLSAREFDHCKAFKIFLDIFDVFYNQFKEKYKETTVLIENRGSNWSGRFLLSKPSEVLKFARILKNANSGLKIALDYPQLFSALYISTNIKKKKDLIKKGIMIDDEILEKIISFNNEIKEYKEVIGGIHMWGKCKDENGNWASHAGNFYTFFSNNKILKKKFLSSVFSTFNDGIARYFVPEVNSGEQDLHSIVTDMEKADFIFLSKNKSINKKILDDFNWNGIKIPKTNLKYRENGFIHKDGWLLQFCFGEKDGKEYMDIYCDHRMTNDRHFRIYEDGTSENLPTFFEFHCLNMNDEKKEEKLNKLIELFREKGFYPFPEETTFSS
jgi:hypothetical protein